MTSSDENSWTDPARLLLHAAATLRIPQGAGQGRGAFHATGRGGIAHFPGDFPDIQSFSTKLAESKFTEFNTLKDKQIEELDRLLNVDIPKLMEMLPSEKDSPEALKAKMGVGGPVAVPVPVTTHKFGKQAEADDTNPFGYAVDDEEHYWYV